MSEMGDNFKEHKQYVKDLKQQKGIDCPGCHKIQPKRIPTRLLIGQTCKVCGYKRKM